VPEPGRLDFRLTVNGETRQEGNTNDMIFSIPELIASISADITLRPGDVIATGTCAGVGKYRRPGGEWLRAEDKLAIAFDGIGQLAHGIASGGGASS
jgi:2-keto-4-pentenoate hydratase/2-oxohepta-3-ene-1,7-dioic acid hydratase in catechol pathway